MVHFCAVPGCANRSNRNTDVSYHSLPLKKKKLLKVWIHNIGRKNLPLNQSTKVCSNHFVNSHGRRLQPNEVPTLNLPSNRISKKTKRKPPTVRMPAVSTSSDSDDDAEEQVITPANVSTQVELISDDSAKVQELTERVIYLERQLEFKRFRLTNIAGNNNDILFYTGFPNYATLIACYNYLGPAVNHLVYWGSKEGQSNAHGRNRLLSPLEEYFMVLVRLRLGLFERDLADRFEVSVATVSRICRTWITFLYLRFKEIPLWPSRQLVNAYMPKSFQDLYPSTRVIIDATEIFIETPALPELQQMTFSSYKNKNTYKVLIGISPGGVVIFVSSLYPGSISDKELTKKSGLLHLLESGDSVMADRGFDIQDELTPLGVRLNISPFLKGKTQLKKEELVETRRIASLRIHVERAIERIKNCHIFDRVIPASLTNVAEQMVFVCTILTNFMPPLC